MKHSFGHNLSLSSANLYGSTQNLSKTGDDADHDKRKLIKLHWKEALLPCQTAGKEDSIWNCIVPLDIDKEKLSHLFELKQNEVKTKVSLEVYVYFSMLILITLRGYFKNGF